MTAKALEIKIGICGLGTVGGGTLTVLAQNQQAISNRAPRLIVSKVAEKDHLKAKALIQELGLKDIQICDDWQDLVADPQIDIIVELIGRVDIAEQLIIAALKAGKSVITANKDLMAAKGGELLHLAEENKVDLFFEASVAGGIPIIQTLKHSFAANNIGQIMGIVNGTTNYILSNMTEKGLTFQNALTEAQQLGYAEADPKSDIEGLDAARKMAILASIAFNSRVKDDMVPTEGITEISNWDILYAQEFGYIIKMIGLAKSDGQSIEVRVHPLMIDKNHPLAAVRDSYNAIFIEGDAVEKSMLYGRGAGALPTGSAVVGDIIAATRNIVYNCRGQANCFCNLNLPVKPEAETISKYYVRMLALDKPGVFADITAKLCEHDVSMHSVMQKRFLSPYEAEIVMITHEVSHGKIMAAVKAISQIDAVAQVGSVIRVEDDRP